MRRIVTALLAAMLLTTAARAGQEPGRVVRDWRIKYEAVNPVGTFDGFVDEGHFRVRLENGTTRVFPVWLLEGRELAYLQRQKVEFPETEPAPETPDPKAPLVDVSAEELADGPLAEWPNAGALGGAFHALAAPPEVAEVAGRRAVQFKYGPAVVDMRFNAMALDRWTPDSVMDGESFTVAAWLYNPGVVDDTETFLSWHTLGGDDGTDLRFGGQKRGTFVSGAYNGPLGGMPFADHDRFAPNQWRHVAISFSGGRDGVMRLYLDGRLMAEQTFDRQVAILPATEIEKTSARLNGEVFLQGDEAGPQTVEFLIGRRDGHYWGHAAGVDPEFVDRWDTIQQVEVSQSGPVSSVFENLVPGTEYVYRLRLVGEELPTVWSDGPMRFRTAGENGEAGEALPTDEQRRMLLGASWGGFWDWAVTPRFFYTGAISELKLYDSELDEREIRNLTGARKAYAPAPQDGAEVEGFETELVWKPCVEDVASYRVYFGEDEGSVRIGRDDLLLGTPQEPSARVDGLELGTTYFWRVDETTAGGEQIEGEIWSFSTPDGAASEPNPADGETGVLAQRVYFEWTPGPYAASQTVSIYENREAAASGEPLHTMQRGPNDDSARFSYKNLALGKTYWWRVSTENRDDMPASPGELWSFSTEDYVVPEFDGPVSEPYPYGVRQDGFVSNYMRCGGQPIVSAADTPEIAMRRARHTCMKPLLKRPDLRSQLAVSNTGGSLDNEIPVGWTELVRNTYGATRNMLLDPDFYAGLNMLAHEMGHQLHMNAMSNLDRDFDFRLRLAWEDALASLNQLGTYGSNNMWEYIAVSVNSWINDGHKDDAVFRRDQLRLDDPYLYFLLNEYWSGDDRIYLNVDDGLEAGPDGAVRKWSNLGGVEFWGLEGWKMYDGTTGAFVPAGAPRLETVDGVSAVAFDGDDAMTWDLDMRPEMGGTHEWSVECWARVAEGSDGGVLFSWTPEEGDAVRLNAYGPVSFDVGGETGAWKNPPAPGAWRHLVYVYAGGGMNDDPAPLRVYVDGVLDHEAVIRPNVGTGAPAVVGAALSPQGALVDGFEGGIAWLRFYDYDLHPDQIARNHENTQGHYAPRGLKIGGRLLVDLDAREFSATPEDDHWPLYPDTLPRPWLRSWANRGTAGGRVFNNLWRESASAPLPTRVSGVEAVRFQGKDMMASLFPADAQCGTLEAWVFVDPYGPGGTVAEFGGRRLTAGALPRGDWKHVALVARGDETALYVNGQRVDAPAMPPAQADRLHVGAHWDGWNWTDHFAGAIAALRIHEEPLDSDDLAANLRAGTCVGGVNPSPADGATVVVAREPDLLWQVGAFETDEYDLYLGTDRAAVAAATPDSELFQGRFAPGELRPVLEPGATYYWRVDPLGRWNKPLHRGEVWTFRTARGLLVALDAEGLPEGELAAWKNAGAAGGAFETGTTGVVLAPSLTEADGAKGVEFGGDKMLRSSFELPASVLGGEDFTLAAVIYDPKYWQNARGAVAVFGERPDAAVEFGIDQDETSALRVEGRGGVGYRDVRLTGKVWQTVVWVYEEGTVRVYVDGLLSVEAPLDLAAAPGEGARLSLGAVPVPGGGRVENFQGLIRSLRLYDDAKAPEAAATLSAETNLPAQDALVVLDAEGLAKGKVLQWENAGSLGGEMRLDPDVERAPVVAEVDGRMAVEFDGDDFMRSTVSTPEALTGDAPFTVEAWVRNPQPGPVETVLSLAPRTAKIIFRDWETNHAVELNAGGGAYPLPSAFANGTGGFDTAWSDAAPPADAWRRLTWVYTGGTYGEVRLYVDGRLDNVEHRVTLMTDAGWPMALGCGWNTEKGPRDLFSGAIGGVRVYDYVRTDEEIAAGE